MPSKPIDPMCPVRLVSAAAFSGLTSIFDETDFHWHQGYLTQHGMCAVWHWDEGVWWTCREFDTFSKMVGVLFDAGLDLDAMLDP